MRSILICLICFCTVADLNAQLSIAPNHSGAPVSPTPAVQAEAPASINEQLRSITFEGKHCEVSNYYNNSIYLSCLRSDGVKCDLHWQNRSQELDLSKTKKSTQPLKENRYYEAIYISSDIDYRILAKTKLDQLVSLMSKTVKELCSKSKDPIMSPRKSWDKYGHYYLGTKIIGAALKCTRSETLSTAPGISAGDADNPGRASGYTFDGNYTSNDSFIVDQVATMKDHKNGTNRNHVYVTCLTPKGTQCTLDTTINPLQNAEFSWGDVNSYTEKNRITFNSSIRNRDIGIKIEGKFLAKSDTLPVYEQLDQWMKDSCVDN